MKKLFLLPILFSLLTITGCQSGGSPTIHQVEEIAKSDAEGGALMAEFLLPSGMEVYNPLLYGIVVGAAAATASANTAYQFRQTPVNDGDYLLDSKFLLSANPYEAIGIAHNKNLISLSQLGRPITTEDIKQNDLLLQLINNYGIYTSAKQQQLLADIKQLQVDKQIYEKTVSNSNFILSVNADITKINFSVSYTKTYLTNFMAEVDAMNKSGDFKPRLYNKVNKAIETLLVEEGVANNAIIAYLTVYKHSYEYWN